jgi:hypothetical protein
MAEYLAEVRMMDKFFDGFEVRYVPCLDNCDADHLDRIASPRGWHTSMQKIRRRQGSLTPIC